MATDDLAEAQINKPWSMNISGGNHCAQISIIVDICCCKSELQILGRIIPICSENTTDFIQTIVYCSVSKIFFKSTLRLTS